MSNEQELKNDAAVIESMWKRIDNSRARTAYLIEGATWRTNPETFLTDEWRALCSARRIIERLTIERDALLREVEEQKQAIRSAIERAEQTIVEEKSYNYSDLSSVPAWQWSDEDDGDEEDD